MKNKKTIAVVLAAAVIIALGCMAWSFADNTDGAKSVPGTADDPIASKSYVDKATQWEIITVKNGQKLIGGQGTQFILRSGKAAAIGNGDNGVSDLTGGADLLTGEEISQNHLMLVPRADGRGALCTTDCYYMVLGQYEIAE